MEGKINRPIFQVAKKVEKMKRKTTILLLPGGHLSK